MVNRILNGRGQTLGSGEPCFHFIAVASEHPGAKTKTSSGCLANVGEMKMKNIMRFLKDKSGATAIEYGLIAALIAVAVISGVTALGGNAEKTFQNVATEIGKGAGS